MITHLYNCDVPLLLVKLLFVKIDFHCTQQHPVSQNSKFMGSHVRSIWISVHPIMKLTNTQRCQEIRGRHKVISWKDHPQKPHLNQVFPTVPPRHFIKTKKRIPHAFAKTKAPWKLKSGCAIGGSLTYRHALRLSSLDISKWIKHRWRFYSKDAKAFHRAITNLNREV